ncbi:bifunctional oligoribonuclease/PAP phosphatase NrnA [Gottschalkiaceae bacterium SANA]|nr:bifunctional oligoribonuclease/PAP phosphatase NrnA [Gottschalkiaceae bacterium SANA]
MNKREANRLHEKLSHLDSVCIVSHAHPDGDSLGSLLGLAALIENHYHCRVERVLSDSTPSRYAFMDTSKAVPFETCLEKTYDACILVDCSDENRLDDAKVLLEQADSLINIDHHRSNESFGQINLVEGDCSSTGELIYQLAKYLNWKLDSEIACNLYVAIATDTGSFQYSNTSQKTHLATAELLSHPFEVDLVRERLFQSEPLNKAKLFITLVQSIIFSSDGQVGGCSVSQENLNQFQASYEDLDGVVEFIRNIETVRISYLIKEVGTNEFRASLRSKPPTRVDKIAHQFGGGGHAYAAGLSFSGNLKQFQDQLIRACEEAI